VTTTVSVPGTISILHFHLPATSPLSLAAHGNVSFFCLIFRIFFLARLMKITMIVFMVLYTRLYQCLKRASIFCWASVYLGSFVGSRAITFHFI